MTMIGRGGVGREDGGRTSESDGRHRGSIAQPEDESRWRARLRRSRERRRRTSGEKEREEILAAEVRRLGGGTSGVVHAHK